MAARNNNKSENGQITKQNKHQFQPVVAQIRKTILIYL